MKDLDTLLGCASTILAVLYYEFKGYEFAHPWTHNSANIKRHTSKQMIQVQNYDV